MSSACDTCPALYAILGVIVFAETGLLQFGKFRAGETQTQGLGLGQRRRGQRGAGQCGK